MKVCVCDRCGKVFKPTESDGEFYNPVIQVGNETFGLVYIEGTIDKTFDVCEECLKDFQRWMKRGRIKNG